MDWFLILTDCVNFVNMLREVCVGLILCFASFCYIERFHVLKELCSLPVLQSINHP